MEAKKGYRAKARNLPISPSKVRPIATHIRCKPYVHALAVLESLPNKGAFFLKKLIQSAAANAMVQDPNLDDENLFIAELLIDSGPSRKTIWPRSRGRADKQIKRSSHISIMLDTKVVD